MEETPQEDRPSSPSAVASRDKTNFVDLLLALEEDAPSGIIVSSRENEVLTTKTLTFTGELFSFLFDLVSKIPDPVILATLTPQLSVAC